jgi:hypothetical protein
MASTAEKDALARLRALGEHWLWYAEKCEAEGHTPRLLFAAAGRRVLAELDVTSPESTEPERKE